jgi:hypothetical protein
LRHLQANFDLYLVAPVTSMTAVVTSEKFWRDRNASIIAGNICSVARSFARYVPAPQTSTTIKGLANFNSYTISIVANGVGGASSSVSVSSGLTPTVSDPLGGTANLGLYLDAASFQPGTTVNRWLDASGNNRHYGPCTYSTSGFTQPVVQPRNISGDSVSGLFFDGSSAQLQGEIISDPNFDIAGNILTHDTSIFIVYKPASWSSNMALFGHGGYGYSTGGGWGVYAQERDTSNNDNVMGFKVLGNEYYTGSTWLWGVVGKTIRWPSGQSHPHLNKVTLVSFVYGRQTPSSTTNVDVTAYGPTSGATAWTAGYFPVASGPNSDSVNLNSVGGFPYDMTNYGDAYTIGAMNSYGLYPYDRFRGTIYSIMVYKSKLTSTAVTTVSNFLTAKYSMSCSPPSSANALSAKITGTGTACPSTSTLGQACTQTCDTFNLYYQVGGSQDMTCKAGRWSGRRIICAGKCQRLATPANAATCTKFFHIDGFNYTGPNDMLLNYDTSPALTDADLLANWIVQADGTITGNNAPYDDGCSAIEPSVLTLNQPAWAASLLSTNVFHVDADVKVVHPQGRGGIVSRFVSDGNYYRFSIGGNATAGPSFMLEKVVNGNPTKIGTPYTDTVTLGGYFHKLRLTILGGNIQAFSKFFVVANGCVVLELYGCSMRLSSACRVYACVYQ